MYSYGNRRIVLGSPFASTFLFPCLVLSHAAIDLLRDAGHLSRRHVLQLDLLWMALIVAAVAFRYLLSFRAKVRPDLPSAFEITSSGDIRLFHGQEAYGDIRIDQIASVKNTPLGVLPWQTVKASELKLSALFHGTDHMYILPYLNGYSDFMSKLYDMAPALRPEYGGKDWENGAGRSYALVLGMLAFFSIMPLVALIALAAGPHRHNIDPWPICFLEAFFIGALFLLARAVHKIVTAVSFYPDKMQLVRGSIWYTDVHQEDISGMEIVPAGKQTEQCIIHTATGDYSISSGDMKDYTGLVRRIRHFIGEPQVSPTQ